MLLDSRLDEERALFRIQSGGESVHRHVEHIGADLAGIGIVAREGVPVGHEIIAFVIAVVLQSDPIGQGPVKIAQMELARGSHPAQNPFPGQKVLLW